MTVFIKTMKMHYALKEVDENPCTRITKKGARQQKAHVATSSFYLDFTDTVCKMYENPPARATRRGPPGSTIIILKVILVFNNHFHPRATPLPPDKELHIRYGFLPHFVRFAVRGVPRPPRMP